MDRRVKGLPMPALLAGVLGAVLVAVLPVSRVEAQNVMHACYVPASGTVYRIKTGDTKESCASDQHVAFSWTSGAGADHGSLVGTMDDDHPQYLLANGVRTSVDGFAVTGTMAAGSIPVSGPGTRVMWYPRKAAFRAGAAQFDEWDDANVGNWSVALGLRAKASGLASFAFGLDATASGSGSKVLGSSVASGIAATAIGHQNTASGGRTIAMGSFSEASAEASIALGNGAIASGQGSLAMGNGTTASGFQSTALGLRASTNGRTGSVVIGDASTVATGAIVSNTADNQFMVRAAGGTILYSNAALTAGVSLAPGAGGWASVSDVNRKTGFRTLDGESVLAKIAAMPIQEWSYKAQDASIRHVGPTAQDFRAAFGLGESDTTITSVDIDGINLLAAQALVRRTVDLQALNYQLREENAAQRARLDQLEARLLDLEQALRAGRRDP